PGRIRHARRVDGAADLVATRSAREAGRAARRRGLLAAVDRARAPRDAGGLRTRERPGGDRRRRRRREPARPPRRYDARRAAAAEVVAPARALAPRRTTFVRFGPTRRAAVRPARRMRART